MIVGPLATVALWLLHGLNVVEAVAIGVIAAIGDATEAAMVAGVFLIIQTFLTYRLTHPVHREQIRAIPRVEHIEEQANQNAADIQGILQERAAAIDRLHHRVEELMQVVTILANKVPDQTPPQG